MSDDSVEFSLHLNLLGEPQTMSGPMEIGETIAVQCKEFGKLNIRLRIQLINCYSRDGTRGVVQDNVSVCKSGVMKTA